MRFLLDTHVIPLAARVACARTGEAVRQDLERPDTELLVSAVSATEVAAKVRLGKSPVCA